jgi:hypothetical protein
LQHCYTATLITTDISRFPLWVPTSDRSMVP